MPTKITFSQSQYQSMVNFEKLPQSLIFFNAWKHWSTWRINAPDMMHQIWCTWRINESYEAAFVYLNRSKSSTTYGKYCEDELLSKLKFTSQNTKRLDLVFDVYNKNSLKSQTKENRGGEMRISVRKDTPICKDFQKFMRNDTNKMELQSSCDKAVIAFQYFVSSIKNVKNTYSSLTNQILYIFAF